jgi:hypothetical protein
MKKKSLMSAMLAGAAAVMGGLISSPAGQQVISQTAQSNSPQIEQKAPAQRSVNQGQQATSRTPAKVVRNYVNNPYGPFGAHLFAGNYGMSPKDYGEYLMRTGKDKQNLRKRKHYATMRS